MRKRSIHLVACVAFLAFAGCGPDVIEPESADTESLVAFSHGIPEYADVMNQSGVGVYAANGSMVVRQTNGLRISMTVPTPAPGSYVYPDGTVPGAPEVFTLWAFVFDYPWNCTPPGCSGDDLGTATGANGGVHNVGGHIASGGVLNISGRIGVGADPFAFASLESPQTAEIHVALAPHGWVDPSRLPNEFRIPVGSPFCGCWWVAIF